MQPDSYSSNDSAALPAPTAKPAGAMGIQPYREPVTLPATTAPAARHSATPAAPERASPPRCSVKGCVFPAISADLLACRQHALEQSDDEAEHFRSRQPTLLLALYAPFGVPDYEPDDSRRQDRHRQAAERESFLLEEPEEEPREDLG